MNRVIPLAALLLVAGCGQLVPGRDYWINQAAGVITTRSAQIAQNICMARGADYGPYFTRNVLSGTGMGSQAGVNVEWWSDDAFGCYDEHDDVIICERGNPACMPHEGGHREGTVQHD